MNQKKAKFNIVDIIVILILVAGIAFVGVRMFGGEEPAVEATAGAGSTYHVTFHAECVREDVANTLTDTTGREGMKFFPFVFSLFMFVLVANLLGMVPGFFTITSQIVVTFALAFGPLDRQGVNNMCVALAQRMLDCWVVEVQAF